MGFLTACGGRSVSVETAPSPANATTDPPAQIALFDDLGPHSRPIVTFSDEAQEYFDQGLLLMYAFWTGAAEESFKAAQAADPDCAACYWGEAWALSPYLNGPMSPGSERRAFAAIQNAKEKRGTASEVERALIDSFEFWFEEDPTGDRRKTLDTRRVGHE